MLLQELHHCKHIDAFGGSEHLSELGIGKNRAFVLLVLKLVSFDVSPEFLHCHRTWKWFRSDNRAKFSGWSQRSHKGCVRFATLFGRLLLCCLFSFRSHERSSFLTVIVKHVYPIETEIYQ
jgi:hypothetical protein